MNGQTRGIDRLGWLTGVTVLLLGLVNLVLLLQIGYHLLWHGQVRRKITDVPATAVQELRAAQAAELEQPLRWVDRDRGIAGLPLAEARAWVLRREHGEARP